MGYLGFNSNIYIWHLQCGTITFLMENSNLGREKEPSQIPSYTDTTHLVGVVMLSKENRLAYKLCWSSADPGEWLNYL